MGRHGFVPHSTRHGRACPGHPRIDFVVSRKTWMPGTRPGMTKTFDAARIARAALQDWQDTIANGAPVQALLCLPEWAQPE
jgi:hypothetical protein